MDPIVEASEAPTLAFNLLDALASARWGDHVAKLITNRHPAPDFGAALHQHAEDEIKVVLEWG